jgi:hypothetical protein
MKRQYSTPVLEAYGQMSELTLGSSGPDIDLGGRNNNTPIGTCTDTQSGRGDNCVPPGSGTL